MLLAALPVEGADRGDLDEAELSSTCTGGRAAVWPGCEARRVVHLCLCVARSVTNLGTEQHRRKYFDDIANFRLPGCFAMTELKHGEQQLKRGYCTILVKFRVKVAPASNMRVGSPQWKVVVCHRSTSGPGTDQPQACSTHACLARQCECGALH